MSTVIEPDHAAVGPVAEWLPTAASVFRLNIEKYEAMVRSGVFTKHDRLHLINGILVAKMTKKPSHVIACEKSRDSLLRAILASPSLTSPWPGVTRKTTKSAILYRQTSP
jgi:hypothetical protein